MAEAGVMIGLLRRPWAKAGTAGLTSAVALAGLAMFGTADGNNPRDIQLLSGAAWLASGRVGQVTLLDGTSTEIAAQVQVAPVGDVLQVVQQGSNAYAVDQTAGTIRRIDGATLEAGSPESPIPDAGAGLTAFAGETSLYVMDSRRGVFTSADPKTGRATGRAQPLAPQVAPNTAAIDGQGRLWLVDNATGDLVWADGNDLQRARGAVQPGRSVLAIAKGKPVVVDTTGRRAFTFDPDSRKVSGSVDIDVRPNEEVQVTGSPHEDRVYVVTPRGVLTICELAAKKCDKIVPLTEPANKLGAAVEAGDRVFVPDYTTGQVWIVNLTSGDVVTKAQVLKDAKQFQLLTRDGVVFYNDPDSDQAGVIRLDGSVQPTAKYDPADPKKGLTGKIANGDAPEQSGATTATSAPTQAPDQQPNQQPSQQPDQQQQNPQQNPTTNNPVNTPVPPQTPSTPPSDTQTPPMSTPNQPPPKPVIKITPSKASPVVNEQITLKVDDANGVAPATANWTFGDGQTGTGAMVPHKWGAVQTFHVTVQVKMPDGQDAETSRAIDVTTPPDATVPVVLGQTQAAATTAITNANLRVSVTSIASNTVASGLVLAQTPAGNTKAPPQSIVNIQVSSGKPPSINLLATAGSAQWRSGFGALPYDGSDGDAHGFVKPRSGFLLEDNSAPAFLETHPQWVANGFTEGTYTLSRAVIAGDHFKATVGFMAVASPPSAGAGTFSVVVIRPNGTTATVASVFDTGKDGVMRAINADLTPYAGATRIRLHVDAGPDAAQDWMSWVAPRIEG
jgi:hypothetical protein